MYSVVGEHVFPFLRTLGGDSSTYARHMKDARFTIPTAALLHRVVDLIENVPMEDRDTKGDVYEYIRRARRAPPELHGPYRRVGEAHAAERPRVCGTDPPAIE
jgi:hypothetical protein